MSFKVVLIQNKETMAYATDISTGNKLEPRTIWEPEFATSTSRSIRALCRLLLLLDLVQVKLESKTDAEEEVLSPPMVHGEAVDSTVSGMTPSLPMVSILEPVVFLPGAIEIW